MRHQREVQQRHELEKKHYSHDGDVLSIPYSYWAGIIRELQENGLMQKALRFLKDAKSALPFI